MSTVAKPRQLNLDEMLRLKWLLGGAMSLVALWTVFFLDIEALSLVAIVSSIVLAGMIWPGLPGRLPPLVWKLSVPAIIVAASLDFYFSPDTLPVFIRLGILLVLYRGIAYRRKREDLQLLVLGLFLIVVAGVLTVSLGFAFLLLAFTACALGFLFVINLVDAAEAGPLRTPEAALAWTRLPWRGFLARLWAVADWKLLTFASVLFLTVVTMSGLLFMIIPRFEVASGFFLDRYITRKSRSGFTDTVRFGDVTNLAQDTSVAMRVDLTDVRGLRDDPYWRLVVLDEYTADGFRVSPGLKADLMRGQRVVQQIRGRQLGRNVNEVGGTWTFYVEPGVSRYLPLPGSYGSLRLRDPVPLQVNAGFRIVALRTEPMTMTAFQLEEVELGETLTDVRFPLSLQQASAASPPVAEPPRYDPRLTLRGPEGPANAAVLNRVLAEITQGEKLPAGEFARRASAWLQGRHAYALSVRIPGGNGEDSIVRWLDSNEPGFCEYFAAGLTVLARAAGHPARVVAGFRGGALNAFENYYMVRNSDAHAWVEIYDGQAAWVRVDPTPGNADNDPNRAAAQAQFEQDSSWSARLDSLRVLWYRRIVNFDSRQQAQMIDQVRTFTSGSKDALRSQLDEYSRRLKAWLARPWDWQRVLRTVATVAGIGAGGWLVVFAFRSGWRGWRRAHGVDPVRRTAGKWLGRIAERGVRNAEWEGVRADLQRLRYGRRETWPEPGMVFRRARRVRRTTQRRVNAPQVEETRLR
jgi:transglutaminase-like putative cysteine protease